MGSFFSRNLFLPKNHIYWMYNILLSVNKILTTYKNHSLSEINLKEEVIESISDKNCQTILKKWIFVISPHNLKHHLINFGSFIVALFTCFPTCGCCSCWLCVSMCLYEYFFSPTNSSAKLFLLYFFEFFCLTT